MASSTSPKQEWLVIIPDHRDALSKRLAARQEHLKNVAADNEGGEKWVLGGAFLSEPIKEGETPKMIGSAMVMLAGSEEEVKQRLREDVYSKQGAWDVEKATIYPFKSAVRSAL